MSEALAENITVSGRGTDSAWTKIRPSKLGLLEILVLYILKPGWQGNDVLAETLKVLADNAPSWGQQIALMHDETMILVDCCLLYTSPSPRDRG